MASWANNCTLWRRSLCQARAATAAVMSLARRGQSSGVAKVLTDATLAGVLWWVQWAWYRAFCMYCVTAAAASFIAAVLAVPETWASLRGL